MNLHFFHICPKNTYLENLSSCLFSKICTTIVCSNQCEWEWNGWQSTHWTYPFVPSHYSHWQWALKHSVHPLASPWGCVSSWSWSTVPPMLCLSAQPPGPLPQTQTDPVLQNKLGHWPRHNPSQNLFQFASYKYYKV
jgi:hypothetical protein